MKENRVAENNEILNKSAQNRRMETLEAIYSTRTHLFAVELSKTY
ncbi:hypothetical protein T05_56 [Trichinella murrelli]|uniref:Uncharacterized protein n=1 Tax=Trichinella murrelli TaxID=144512 RepID=A0A0V0SX63_9BILA|nr:hypothetical protein T05_56 [Trichinella murrelli]